MSIRSSKSKSLVMGLAVIAVATLGLSAVVTGAVFTDTKTVSANTFTSGSVALTATPASAALTFANMAPGDKVTAPITVTNTGTLAHRYAVVSVTTENTLAAQLTLNVKSGVTACTNGGFGTDGVSAWAGILGSTAAGTKIIGDSLAGSQAGDRVLAAGTNEVLCAQVTLPLATGNTFQSLTSTATFTFNAEQTINNP
ncbi:MAG: TasA family protein [Propionicimonas sp.]